MQHEIFKYFLLPCPTSRPIIKFLSFSRFPDMVGNPVRIINSDSYFMKDSLKRNWWKLLCGNENVNKLRSFIDFGVPLNYNFELRTFLISAAQIVANGGKMGGIEERWEGPSKAAEFLGSAKEWNHISTLRREREASLIHLLSLSVQRIKPRPSIQPIIKFVGLTTRAMRQSETPFCLSNFETKHRDGHRERKKKS